jgi:hypothetical protein
MIQALRQCGLDAANLRPREAVVLPKFRPPCRTVQVENSLAAAVHNVHVSRPVIVRINHDPQPTDAINSRHSTKKPKRLGYFGGETG